MPEVSPLSNDALPTAVDNDDDVSIDGDRLFAALLDALLLLLLDELLLVHLEEGEEEENRAASGARHFLASQRASSRQGAECNKSDKRNKRSQMRSCTHRSCFLFSKLLLAGAGDELMIVLSLSVAVVVVD